MGVAAHILLMELLDVLGREHGYYVCYLGIGVGGITISLFVGNIFFDGAGRGIGVLDIAGITRTINSIYCRLRLSEVVEDVVRVC